jgi:hypothetical protein
MHPSVAEPVESLRVCGDGCTPVAHISPEAAQDSQEALLIMLITGDDAAGKNRVLLLNATSAVMLHWASFNLSSPVLRITIEGKCGEPTQSSETWKRLGMTARCPLGDSFALCSFRRRRRVTMNGQEPWLGSDAGQGTERTASMCADDLVQRTAGC